MERLHRVVGVFGVIMAGVVATLLFMLPQRCGVAFAYCAVVRVVCCGGVIWLALIVGCRHARRERLMFIAQEGVGSLLEQAMQGGEGVCDLYHSYLSLLVEMSGSLWGGVLLVDKEKEGGTRFLWTTADEDGVVSEMDGGEVVERLVEAGLWQRVAVSHEHVAYPGRGLAYVDFLDLFPRGMGRRFRMFPLFRGDELTAAVMLSGFPQAFRVVNDAVFDTLGTALAQGLCHREAVALRRKHYREREQWAETLRARVSELEDSESRFRRLVESSADAVMIVGSDGHVMYVNPAASTFYARSKDELLGHPVEAIGEPGGRSEIRVFPPGGEPRWGEVRTVDTIWEGDPSFLVSVRDVTQRKRAEEALQRHKDQLEELVDARTNELRQAVGRLELHNRAKSEFVSNVSHELRTPLASLRSGLSNMLRGICGPLGPQVVSYLSMLHEETERLIATVEDILDISRIETGRLKLYCMPVPVRCMCEHAVEMLQVAARAKSIEFSLGYDWCRAFVDGDMAKLDRVCSNIVENAIKYTPDEGRVSVVLEQVEGESIRLRVCDTGVGIGAEDLPHVLERYYRVGSHVDGIGVGLALSAEIIRAHGGTIEVFSPPVGEPTGTEVRVVLPVVAPPCVAVVDGDGVAAGGAAVESLRSLGYRVETFDVDAATGVGFAERGVDVLMLDMSEPGMSGLEVLARLRQQDERADLPVLVLVGAGREEAKRSVVRNLGAVTLGAPYSEGRLLRMLQECLVRRRDVPFVHSGEGSES